MSVVIDDETLEATHLSEAELKREIAIFLFEDKRLTLGRASRFAEMSQFQFQHILASREIPVHYGVDDLEQDLKTLDSMNS
jgi:predicted HTH domain antitoxin